MEGDGGWRARRGGEDVDEEEDEAVGLVGVVVAEGPAWEDDEGEGLVGVVGLGEGEVEVEEEAVALVVVVVVAEGAGG